MYRSAHNNPTIFKHINFFIVQALEVKLSPTKPSKAKVGWTIPHKFNTRLEVMENGKCSSLFQIWHNLPK